MFTKTATRLSNKYRLVRSFRRRSPVVQALPSILNMETSSLCNLRCPMCTREQEVRRRIGTMPLVLYRNIVDEVAQHTELLVLHNSGEPLMNDNIFAMIEYARSRDIHSMLSTNATLLDEERGIRILESGLSLMVIAVDGATKKTYETIRRGAVYEETERNIVTFLENRKRLDRRIPSVVLQMVEMKENRQEIPKFREKWRGKGVHTLVKPSTAPGRKGRSDHTYPCDRLWFQGIVLSDGEVLPCCEDLQADFTLGNAEHDTFSRLWNSEKMEQIRRTNLIPGALSGLCRNCNYHPPRRHTAITAAAQCLFDMKTLALLLYVLGYRKQSQL